MLQFARVKYLLDSLPTEFLRGNVQANTRLAELGGKPHFVGVREFAVRLSEVRLVYPVEEKPSVTAVPDERRGRAKVNVALEVDEWEVSGELWMSEQQHWLDFIVSSEGDFLPLSQVKIEFGGGVPPGQLDFVLVNSRHITAMQEAF